MSKPLEKQKAIELRKAGLSYREIRRQVSVSKSTLSLWLRSVGLSHPQKQRLTAKKLLAGRRGGRKVHLARVERVQRTIAEAETEARQRIVAGDWLWVVGTALYWAEGSKSKAWRTQRRVEVTNMDISMIILIRKWLYQCCSVPEPDICYDLYIHEGFTHRRNIGRIYHGTMRMRVRRSTELSDRIAGWIQGLVAWCGVV